MPRYELTLILKALERPELVKAIKRSAEAVMERGGIVRSFENLGTRELPYRMFAHVGREKRGTYFLVNFDSPGTPLISLLDHLQRDLDIIRPRILRKEEEVTRPCEKGPCDFGELDEEKKRTVKLNLRNLVKKL
ncbi:28S ribosomal protein S6, mitochondrial [Lamellibrachia satsuma]|nr:28S ribosomal protein S6, mitochondrial [Lamellibrachia satsuma]